MKEDYEFPLYATHFYICDYCKRKVEVNVLEGLPMIWKKDRPEKFCSYKCADAFGKYEEEH